MFLSKNNFFRRCLSKNAFRTEWTEFCFGFFKRNNNNLLIWKVCFGAMNFVLRMSLRSHWCIEDFKEAFEELIVKMFYFKILYLEKKFLNEKSLYFPALNFSQFDEIPKLLRKYCNSLFSLEFPSNILFWFHPISLIISQQIKNPIKSSIDTI